MFKFSYKQIAFLVLLIVALSFQTQAQYCTNDDRYTEVNIFSLLQIDSTANAVYANALNRNSVMQELNIDVFYPGSAFDTAALRPLILMIHGGAFLIGQKEQMHYDCIQLSRKGYVTATIEYRLGDSSDTGLELLNRQYRAEQDARAAMRWLVDNAATYKIDTSWMFIGGYSAGSLISHGLIYTQQSEWDAVTPLVSAALGDIDNSGNSLTHNYDIKGLYNNCGSIYSPNVDVNEMVPTVAFHKEYDHLVEIDTSGVGSYGSNAMYDWLSNEGVCAELTIDTNYYLPTATSQHCPWVGLQGTNFRVNRTSCFFKSVFCSACNTVLMVDSVSTNCSTFLSVEDNNSAPYFEVYPNPFVDQVSFIGLADGIPFEIRNGMGQIVRELKTGDNAKLNNLKPGIYFITITTEYGVRSKKLIKH